MPDEDRPFGEDRLVQRYFAPLAAGFAGAYGLQDDCAVLAPEPGHDLVLKTDAIAEGVHFLPTDAPEDVAWKAIAVNVSDLAAKGAKPVGYLLSAAFPDVPSEPWLTAFAGGLREAQDSFGVVLMGGDTDRRPNAPFSLTIAAVGSVPSGRMVRRGTARPGDVLYVTGTLGDSALGLRLRSGTLRSASGIVTPHSRMYLEGRFLRPEPRIGMRQALLDHARAAMDLSDGLVKDLTRMCRASGVSAAVKAADVPLSDPARAILAAEPDLAHVPLTGGDDYEVLASVPPENAAAFEAKARAAQVRVTRIGRMGTGAGVSVEGPDGAPVPLPQTGYDHFST